MKNTSEDTFKFNHGIGGWLEYFQHSEPMPSGSDILCAGLMDPLSAAAGFAATVAGLVKEKGRPFYLRILIIFPPTALDSQSREELVESFYSQVMEYVLQDFTDRERDLDARAVETALRQRIQIEVPDDQQTSTLVDILSSVSAFTAVFIISADIYSPGGDSEAPVLAADTDSLGDALRFHLGEDLWVHNVYEMATQVTRLAEAGNFFTLLFLRRNEPAGDENLRLLHSIENCAFLSNVPSTSEQRDDSILMSNASRWLELARTQQINEVIKEIDATPLSPINRALVKAQSLMAAGRPLLSYDIIEPFLDQIISGGNPRLLLKTARIATQAGHYSSALDLLRAAMRSNPADEFDLNIAYRLARTLGAVEEESWYLERLAKLYPDSVTVFDRRFEACRDQKDFRKLAEDIESKFKAGKTIDEIHYIHLLASAFAKRDVPDYDQLIRDVASALPSYKYRAVLASASDTIRRGWFSRAAELCLKEEWPQEMQRHAVWRVISALEGLLLMRQKSQEDETQNWEEIQPDTPEEAGELIRRSIVFTLDFLSREASNGAVRAALYRALSMETTGLNGLIHLTSIILTAPPPEVKDSQEETVNAEPLPTEELTAIWETLLSMLPKPFVLGIGQIPPLPTKPPLDRLLQSVIWLLGHTSEKTIIDESDVQLIYLLLHVGILLSRETGVEYETDLIGLAAGGLCATGNYQAARNLAELCLKLASPKSSNLRRREAWLRYADIYLRCHNPFEALIGLSCALQCTGVSISRDYRYHELVLICRTLRDLRLFPYALSIIPLAREHAPLTSKPHQSVARLDQLEISINLQLLVWKGSDTSQQEEISGLVELGKRTMELNRMARTNSEDVLPTAILLAQVIQRLVAHGHHLDEELKTELEASLPLVGKLQAGLLQAFEAAEPSAETIEMLSRTLPKTRYNEDFGTDVTMITLLARRALNGAAKAGNPYQTLYLLEWLTDLSLNSAESHLFTRSDSLDVAERAISAFMGAAASRPELFSRQEELAQLTELDKGADPSQHLHESRYPGSAEELADIIREISALGLDVHCIGIDSTDALVRVSAVAGELSLMIEPATVFDRGMHQKWEQQYPYDYARLEADDAFALNVVEQGLDRIGITAQQSGRPALLVPDVRLQNIPPNLLLINGSIASFDRPMASTPSLTWLRAARSSERLSNGRRYAWIPTSAKPDDILSRLMGDVTDTLTEHHFVSSQDSVMPVDMRDVDIAILGAHGGIHGENQFFRVVADEKSTRLTARDVAGMLRGSGVVILFVCSGGRLDRHPYASASVGLPHLLLDYGCRAVIASPWPLDVRVAGHWLPAFLESFVGGENVITANYTANREVARQFSSHPMLALAMNVIGNPLAKHRI